jgi:hypothetical protein
MLMWMVNLAEEKSENKPKFQSFFFFSLVQNRIELRKARVKLKLGMLYFKRRRNDFIK